MNEDFFDEPFQFLKNAVLKHCDFMGTINELQDRTEEFRVLSGAKVVIMNEISLSEDYLIFRASAGIEEQKLEKFAYSGENGQ
ncbi:MAG: hypothetical protein JEZ04_02625 [Spirochaetales bacterium]|nr:hypothetical protein [Spirochaetales bacterium]